MRYTRKYKQAGELVAAVMATGPEGVFASARERELLTHATVLLRELDVMGLQGPDVATAIKALKRAGLL